MKIKLSLIFSLFLLLSFNLIASNTNKKVRVTYETRNNGKLQEGAPYTIMDIAGGVAHIFIKSTEKADRLSAPVQDVYVDYNTNRLIRKAVVNGEEIHAIDAFELNKGLEQKPDAKVETIAGYKCKKAVAIINSNTLEVWYTTELGVSGTMQPGVAIPEGGVVLKVVRNGAREEVATKVEITKESANLLPTLAGKPLKLSAYNYKMLQSKVLAYRVFDNEDVYFRDIEKVTALSDTEVMRFANGSIILKKVKLPADNKNYSIFAELSQHSMGDAYDRTGSIFMIPTNRKQSFVDGLLNGKDALPKYTDKHGIDYQGIAVTPDYLPALELMRFYTSFGVRGYNHLQTADYVWPDSVVFKQEITDYAKFLKDEVWIGAWIGNYAHNGHAVTLDIKYYPGQRETEKEAYPLFTTTNIMEMAGQTYPEKLFKNDTLSIEFTTDVDLENAYLRYTSTGHGGWGGGDEFNPKLNEIFLDGSRIMGYTPWREDCGSYRGLNPASGNFSNGLSSSDLSRSGWCPGTVSYPVHIYIGDVKAGAHNVKVAIPVGEPEGNGISYWCISGVLVGDKAQ